VLGSIKGPVRSPKDHAALDIDHVVVQRVDVPRGLRPGDLAALHGSRNVRARAVEAQGPARIAMQRASNRVDAPLLPCSISRPSRILTPQAATARPSALSQAREPAIGLSRKSDSRF
jgi:hypothetical protein